jgi:hypothetical protein
MASFALRPEQLVQTQKEGRPDCGGCQGSPASNGAQFQNACARQAHDDGGSGENDGKASEITKMGPNRQSTVKGALWVAVFLYAWLTSQRLVRAASGRRKLHRPHGVGPSGPARLVGQFILVSDAQVQKSCLASSSFIRIYVQARWRTMLHRSNVAAVDHYDEAVTNTLAMTPELSRQEG